MGKKKILFTTVHPAPYIDRMLEYLNNEYELTVIYNKLSDKYKQWGSYKWYKGFTFDDLSNKQKVLLIKESDILIISGWASWENIILIIFSWILNRPTAVFSDCPESVSKFSLLYWFKRLFLFKLIDYLLCATNSTKSFYSRFYSIKADKLKIFPYAIHFSNSHHIHVSNENKANELEKVRLPEIFISNSFYRRKGYSIIYEVFEELSRLGLLEKFNIKIAGTGDEYDYYREKFHLLSPNIKLLGWLEYNEYINYLNNSDIFIHASFFEPFGIPPVDAMACGKIVIVSDGVQSTCDIIENGQNGFIYNSTDWQQLVSIITNIDLRSKNIIGKNAIDTAKTNFSYTIYSKVLRECLK